MNKSALSTVATQVAVAAAYFGIASLSLILAFPGTNISPVWPPSGVAMAAALLLGWRIWPGILAGAFAANLAAFVAQHRVGLPSATAASLVIAMGNTAEAVIGARLLSRRFDATKLLDRVDNVFHFIFVTLIACAVSGAIGATVHSLLAITAWSSFPSAFATWWLGDAAGALFVAPPILMCAVKRRLHWSRANRIEVPAIITALVFYFLFVFVRWHSEPLFHSDEYLLMPLLLWVAFRLGRRATTVTVFIVCAVSIALTVHGVGPYSGHSISVSLLSLQLFVGLVALTFMLLMASLTERLNALTDLHVLTGMLESLVEERTHELTLANEDKNQFLGMAAHDLRSALNGVIGFSDLLALSLKEKLERRQSGMLENIRDSSRYMLRLVENLLDVSTIEAGRLELDLHPTNISATVERSVSLNSLMAATKSITLDYESEGAIDVSLDERRFEQVISNMITNAIKYSPPGTRVGVEVRRADGNALISVRDEGVGISDSDRLRLFRPFEKGQRSGTAGERSTGLGLAIAQKIVVHHGGRMWVESSEGHGSTFYVSIPAIG